jgi:hypothetical protein
MKRNRGTIPIDFFASFNFNLLPILRSEFKITAFPPRLKKNQRQGLAYETILRINWQIPFTISKICSKIQAEFWTCIFHP